MKVDPQLLADIRETYAPSNHYVFDLVPPEFGAYAEEFMERMGRPEVNMDSFWVVYSELLGYFQALEEEESIQVALTERAQEPCPPQGFTQADPQFVPILPNLKPARIAQGSALTESEGTASAQDVAPNNEGELESDSDSEYDSEVPLKEYAGLYSSDESEDSGVEFSD